MKEITIAGRGGGNQIGESSRRVAELRLQSPDMPGAEIARQLGISRERVRQILAKRRLPTRVKWAPKNRCSRCNARLRDRTKTGLCLRCLKERRHMEGHTKLVCEVCGVSFERRASRVRAQAKRGYVHTFCGKVCQGRWLGAQRGSYHPITAGR
ncbi:MAG: hypothetical protein HY671_06410 [Chloroflexi bacterium]|nr:hypothetical protein [Chloroflexota bacterium]